MILLMKPGNESEDCLGVILTVHIHIPAVPLLQGYSQTESVSS